MGTPVSKLEIKKEYLSRIASDPALQEYERIYKLHHAQMERDEHKERPTGKISRAKKGVSKMV